MRKRITCKVVRSVPLVVQGDGALGSASRSSAYHRAAADVAAFTYTDRFVVMRASLDDFPAARTLDLYA